MKLPHPSKKMQVMLIILLVLMSVSVRLYKTHQTDFDSYWLHGMAESIQNEKSAPWILHPASLIGFYPMSYPSGTPFFLATMSELTGLDMNATIFLSSILLGILISGLVFILAERLFKSWFLAFISALITSLSPTLINYTTFNAGGRILILPFALILMWSLVRFGETHHYKYVLLGIISFLFSLLTHRTVMFLVPIIFAFILANIYLYIPKVWEFIRNHRHYKRYLHPRYEKSKYYLLLDLGLVVLLLIFTKILDLLIRGRFMYNITPIITKAEEFAQTESFVLMFFVTAILLVAMLFILIMMRLLFKKNLIRSAFKFFHHHYHQVFVQPQKYFKYLLLLIISVLFVNQFFGRSFYSPSYLEYQYGFLEGSSPLIIFVNFFVNYTTSITPLFTFAMVGVVVLILTSKEDVEDWTMIFIAIFFSGLLLDKRYTKIFLIPLISIFSAYGVCRTYKWLYDNKKKMLSMSKYLFITIMVLSVIVGSQAPLIRSFFKPTTSSFDEVSDVWEAGQYVRTLGKDFSTITTDELVAGVVIFASSGVPGASNNIYYFVDKDHLRTRVLSLSTIKDRVMNGEKIQTLWYLNDWILGGQYYLGRHARYTFNHPFTDRTNKRIISDYKERFYIHDNTLETNKFLDSIKDMKNVVYDNSRITIYDLEKGR